MESQLHFDAAWRRFEEKYGQVCEGAAGLHYAMHWFYSHGCLPRMGVSVTDLSSALEKASNPITLSVCVEGTVFCHRLPAAAAAAGVAAACGS